MKTLLLWVHALRLLKHEHEQTRFQVRFRFFTPKIYSIPTPDPSPQDPYVSCRHDAFTQPPLGAGCFVHDKVQ